MKQHHFLRSICLTLLLALLVEAQCQTDSTAYVKNSSKKGPGHIGLFAGTGYSMLQLDSRAFFSPNNSSIGSVNTENSLAFCGGVMLTNIHWRIGLEALLSNNALVYDIGDPLLVHRTIQPLTVGLPMSYSFYLKHNGDLIHHGPLKLIAGIRPSTSFAFLDTQYPQLSKLSVAADFGVGYQFDYKMSKCNIELVYSRGLNNLMNAQNDNYQNMAIKRLSHDMIGLRAYFN